MKNIYFAVVLSLLLFAGCSSTYRVNDFSSKEKFYNDFNNSFKTKEVKVTLINDSTFTASEGTIIKDSTLISYVKVEEKKNMFLARSDLREINFENNEINTAAVVLKNGDKLRAENVSVVRDSINFVGIKNLIKIDSIPLGKVKTASYKNRWKSIYPGAMMGLLSGSIIGYLWGKTVTNDHGENQGLSGFLGGAFVGPFVGAISGFFLGYTNIYEFNK